MSSVVGFFKAFSEEFIPQLIIPQLIKEGADLYSEIPERVQPEALVPVMIGRFSYHVSAFIGDRLSWTNKMKIIAGFGFAWALGTYKGLPKRTWMVEWGAVAGCSVLKSLIPKDPSIDENDSKELKIKKKQKQAFNAIVKSYLNVLELGIFFSLKANRLGDRLLPYFSYGMEVACLYDICRNRFNKWAFSFIESPIYKKTPDKLKRLVELILVVARDCFFAYSVGRLMNDYGYLLTGVAVRVDRRAQALGILGVHAAKSGLDWLLPHNPSVIVL